MNGPMKVCLGGTFHPFHKGHKELLRTAYQTAGSTGSVFIGITSSSMITKDGNTPSFERRKESIEKFLKQEKVLHQTIIRQLFNKYGPTIEGDFDVIIVSPETKPTAEEINTKRKQLGRKPLEIIVVPFVVSADGQPISSTRIRRNEIDENGNLLRGE
jgi:pantetheine-phosphate adenylyltransferase